MARYRLKNPLWIHCASVGEVNAVAPLLRLVLEKHPSIELLVTTNTPTGRNVLIQQFKDTVTHYYLPLDYRCLSTRLIKKLKPRALLLVETELWPNLLSACSAHKIPVAIINGRLSQRTLSANAWLKSCYADCLQQSTAILARSNQDAESFIALGASAEKVKVIGNIKFSFQTATSQQHRLIDRPYVLFASSHHDEEQQLTECWQQLLTENHSDTPLLVIVPRHPERGPAILNQLQSSGLELQLRSTHPSPASTTDIYIADTLGELRQLICHAQLVVMGGSFIPHGGQNLLEPAAFGKAIIVGPSMENFAEETSALLAKDAIIQVPTIDAAKQQIKHLLADNTACTRMGEAAQKVMKRESQVAKKYLQAIETILADQ